MVKVDSLIGLFQTMYKEHWSYVWGEAKKGCVDCSGAFDYSMRVLGGPDYPHGSNAIARRYTVGGLLPISKAEPGMAAFKARKPGEDKYDLPDKYLPGGSLYNGDLNDYYHIGLVDSDTRYVLNAKGTNYGFCRDELGSSKGWDFVGYLKGVDYIKQEETGDKAMDKAKVVLPSGASGSNVNMRKSNNTAANIIEKVPVGETVEILEDLGKWCKIEYNGKTGYMMSNYIEYVGQENETDTITPEQRDTIDKALKEIERQIDVIGEIVGRG